METIQDIAEWWGCDPHTVKHVVWEGVSNWKYAGVPLEFVGLHVDERGDLCACVRVPGELAVFIVHPSLCTPK